MSLGKSDPPPPPDYVGAARTQGAANVQSTIASNILNNPTQITPYGTLSRTQTGTFTVPGAEGNAPVDIPQFTSNISLTPQGQQLLDINQGINVGLGNIAQKGLGYVQGTLDRPFDWGAVAKAPVNAGTTGQQAIMSRLQPQIDIQNAQFETQMRNQGVVPGSEAYNNARRVLAQQQNDQLTQAALYGINLDTSARQQQIQEQEFARAEPLNMLNAVRSSAPINLPQFQSAGNAQITPPNILGATEAQGNAAIQSYNAQQAQQAGLMNGLFSLGSSAILGGFNPFSLGGGGSVVGAGLSPYSFAGLGSNLIR